MTREDKDSLVEMLAKIPVTETKGSLMSAISRLLRVIDISESSIMIPTLLKDKCEFDAYEMLTLAKILKASILGHNDLVEFYMSESSSQLNILAQHQQQQQQYQLQQLSATPSLRSSSNSSEQSTGSSSSSSSPSTPLPGQSMDSSNNSSNCYNGLNITSSSTLSSNHHHNHHHNHNHHLHNSSQHHLNNSNHHHIHHHHHHPSSNLHHHQAFRLHPTSIITSPRTRTTTNTNTTTTTNTNTTTSSSSSLSNSVTNNHNNNIISLQVANGEPDTTTVKLLLQIEQLKTFIPQVTGIFESIIELYKNSVDTITYGDKL